MEQEGCGFIVVGEDNQLGQRFHKKVGFEKAFEERHHCVGSHIPTVTVVRMFPSSSDNPAFSSLLPKILLYGAIFLKSLFRIHLFHGALATFVTVLYCS